MKNSCSLLALVAALALGTTAFATSQPQTIAMSDGTELVLSKMVNPTYLPRDYSRSVLNVRFALDEAGQPQDVRVVTKVDPEVKKQVVKAVKEWRFDASSLPSDAESRHYVLPIDLIPEQ